MLAAPVTKPALAGDSKVKQAALLDFGAWTSGWKARSRS